jgi:TM2 domain-containing membrane protein YozV
MKSFLIFVFLVGIGIAVFKALQASKEDADFRQIGKLPASVQNAVARMDTVAQAAFFNELDKKRKKVAISYFAWILFGFHYLYNGKVGLQFAYWFTLGGFGFWSFADLFRMPSIVRSSNEMIARNALQTLSVGMAFQQSAVTATRNVENPQGQ